MRKLLSIACAALFALAQGQTIIEVRPPTRLNMDSIIKANSRVMTDGMMARAMGIAGHASHNLEERCGLHAVDGKKTLADLGMTAQVAKETYPDTWRWLTSEKTATGANRWTTAQADATIVKLSKFDACWSDALWVNSPYIPLEGSRGLLLSCNDITIPHGAFWLTIQADDAYGNYSGSGNFNASDQTGLGGTELHMWHPNWQGDLLNRNLMAAFHGGTNNFFAYSEGQQIRNIRFNGELGNLDTYAFTVTGLLVWDSGEGSHYTDMFAHHCHIGFDFVRGTPTTIGGTLSGFENLRAAFAFTGAAGAMINVEGTLSGDDNALLIWQRPGWGRPGGGLRKVSAIKAEALITPGRFYRPNTIKLEGWTELVVDAINWSANAYATDMFDVKADVNTSHILVNSMLCGGSGKPVQNFFYNRLSGAQYAYDNSWTTTKKKFEWYSHNGGEMHAWPVPGDGAILAPTMVRTNNTATMGYLLGDPQTGQPVGSFNYGATPSPTWSNTTGNSVGTTAPCTAKWVLGVKNCTSCIAGQRECVTDWVSDGTCQPLEPKPAAMMQAEPCTTNPPTGVKWDSTKDPRTATLATTATTSTTRHAADAAMGTCTKFTATKFKVNALPTGNAIVFINSQVYIGSGGKVYTMGTGTTVQATVTAGVSKPLAITFPAATITHVIGSGLSGTALFTAEKLTLE